MSRLKAEFIDRCKCCLEEIGLKNMWTENYSEGEREIYGEMLTDCFALAWEQPSGDTGMELICESCVARLKDAYRFKKEILHSEQVLSEQLKNVSETCDQIKQEDDSEAEIETEYLSLEYLDNDNEDDKTDIKMESALSRSIRDELILNRKLKRYTEEDLEQCIEAVRTKTLSQNKASLLYNVPRKTISAALANAQLLRDCIKSKKRKRPELQKPQENIDLIMKYTNATPFKGYLRTGYACYFCLREYDKAIDLKYHTITEHGGDNMPRVNIVSDRSVKIDLTDLVCKICGTGINSLEKLLDHLKIVHNLKIHTEVNNHLVPFKFQDEKLNCTVCSEEFLTFKLLNDHMNSQHYRNYECLECGRGFINKRSLQTHSYRHETGIFTCQFCGKVFTTRIRCLDHTRSVHISNSKRHKCGYCGEKFVDIIKKNEHEEKVHSAAKPIYKCQACNKIYKSQKSLRSHVKGFHLMFKPFKCSICDVGFYRKMDLKMHTITHTGEKDYQCDVCSKTYGRKSTLREHMRIHADDRRFKCMQCGQGFVQKCSWRSHMRAKHGEPSKIKDSKVNQRRKYETENHDQPKQKDTPSQSLLREELRKHGENIATILINTNATPIKCHNDFGYMCNFCSEAFINPADLKQHTLKNHEIAEKKNYIKGKHVRSYLVKLDITSLMCKLCNNVIDNLEDMMHHLKNHGEIMHFDINNHIVPFKFDGEELRCVICNIVFDKFKMLLEHMNRHSKNYVCDVCGSGYVNRTTFNLHYQNHEKGSYSCNHCSKVFGTRTKKRYHELVVHIHLQKTSKCGFCGEKFSTRRKKEKHISSIHGVAVERLKCQVCGKECPTKNALTIHMKRDQLQERRFACELCDMKFFSSQELKNHMLKHTGVKEFQCDLCKKSYGKKWTLREHIRIHADDRRYKCGHCAMAFVQRCSLIAHIKSKHVESNK